MDEDKHYPCDDCTDELCDGWEAQFCCALCHYNYGDDTPCEYCDPFDI